MRNFFLILIVTFSLHAGKYEEKLATLYDSIDPSSLTEQFAFYSLYPETNFGKEALKRCVELINKHRKYPISLETTLTLPEIRLDPIVSLVTRQSNEELTPLSKAELGVIQKLSSHLSHLKLIGHSATKTSQLVELHPDDIDIARAILLYQFGDEKMDMIETYEASLDLMALQILAKLPKNASSIEKIEAMNHFIFHEMRYRFPPHSMWAKDVDLYTFLTAVLDSRHGVCLGVSILYLSLAQRLDLPLVIITPPGHIYISYQEDGKHINIETTARGIHLPDEAYLGINTKLLHKRNMKEVIGHHFQNAAATAWHHKNYEKAIELYKEGLKYLPDDALMKMFLGITLLFSDKIEEGKHYLQAIIDHPLDEMCYQDTTVEDFLAGKAPVEGIKAIYQQIDETRESILEKQKYLHEIVEKYPLFREGIFHLAVTYLQLGRSKEALEILEKYHDIDANNPTVEYYLTLLCKERLAYEKAYLHFKRLKTLLAAKNHYPRALSSLEDTLRKSVPAV